jgi:hypothetical protein
MGEPAEHGKPEDTPGQGGRPETPPGQEGEQPGHRPDVPPGHDPEHVPPGQPHPEHPIATPPEEGEDDEDEAQPKE